MFWYNVLPTNDARNVKVDERMLHAVTSDQRIKAHHCKVVSPLSISVLKKTSTSCVLDLLSLHVHIYIYIYITLSSLLFLSPLCLDFFLPPILADASTETRRGQASSMLNVKLGNGQH